ncbi:UdgX family uracil-DNA binding protein [Luteipulveratus flavus]|uniref:Type-4 uracil-DNA glycosylase n=1 Tax=Luteipulveratus flavus TaxID=3031728 RepID=A0ABT6C7C0_9MICO|nr:UdgX family uracil-DNA binding protein [Luteipulveratus sp. YIM 133296]MDF8264843.1 UdgX family uracil-DNA binding protein [Luteipulveratus sp. YIM 133296]
MTAKDWPGAEQWVPEHADHDALSAAVQRCRGCDLYENATQAVMGEGPPDARVMMVGEQPGDQEDQAGQPFVGPAGKLLVRAITEAGLDPTTIYRTNVVKHFRFTMPSGTRRIHKSPAGWQVRACVPWLHAELADVRPSTVVLLGATAAKAVMGTDFSVTERRGELLTWPDRLPLDEPPERLLATVHPSSVLRSNDHDADFAALVDDLRRVAS